MPEEKNSKKTTEGHNNPSEVSEKENSQVPKTNKKFYKKAWFWLVIVLGVIGVGLVAFFAIYFSAQNTNKKAVSTGWDDIAKQANALALLGTSVNDKTSFDKYALELKNLNSSVADKSGNVQKLRFPNNDVEKYSKFLAEYGSYTSRATSLADKINDYTESDNDKLKELSEVAKLSAKDARDNIKYLSSSMPDDAFKIQDVLSSANKTILSKELSIKAQEQAAQAQSAKDKADKSAVEANTGNYLNAFIAGNAAKMRQYMTAAYQAEYNFNQLTAESRAFVYPASFRILTTTKVDSSNYKVQANVLFKYRDGSSQYTIGDELNFVYDSGSASWLVNSVKEGSAF